jgi:hypothetical protein
MRRHQKEQAERERLRVENEKRREREEEEALEKARYSQILLVIQQFHCESIYSFRLLYVIQKSCGRGFVKSGGG